MDTMTQTQTSDTMLDAVNRCDRCGAHANVTANKGDSVLLFCRHHWREVKDGKVRDWADRIILWAVDPREG